MRVERAIKSTSTECQKVSYFGDGSWIDFPSYMGQNESIRTEWTSVSSESKDYVVDILELNLWDKSADDIRNIDYHLFYNALTFCCWFDSRFSRERCFDTA